MSLEIDQDQWTWDDFSNEVLQYLPQDKQRIGMGDYIQRLTRQAVIDLQKFIPEFTKRHETIYYPQDFVDDGAASVGVLPPSSKLIEAWMFNVEKAQRFEVVQWPWERRFEMVNQEIPDLLDNEYVMSTTASLAAVETINKLLAFAGPRKHCGIMAISPNHQRIYLYPKLADAWVMSIFWDGTKMDFRSDERVPFGEDAALAVSFYVRGHIALEVDRDAARKAEMMKEYALLRTNIYLEQKSKGDLKQ